MTGVGEGASPGDRVVDGIDACRQVDLGQVGVAGLVGGPRGPLGATADAVGGGAATGGAEATGDLVERGEHFGGFQVEEGQGPYGGAQFTHGDGGPQPAAHDVTDDQGGAMPGEFDHVEPVATHLGRRVARQIAAGDVEARGLGVAGWQQTALEDECAFVLAPVEAGVVYTDGGAGGQFGGEGTVALAEGFAALRTGELDEADDGVMGDHRHGEGGLDQTAVVSGDVLDPAGTQSLGAGGVEGVAVDCAQRWRVGVPVGRGAVRNGVRHGAGEADAAQFGGAADGLLAERAPPAGRCLVPGEQPLVEVDGGEVAEAGYGHVEEFAGGGLQVEGVADAGTGLVEEGEVTAGAGGLAGSDMAAGDIGGQTGDADGLGLLRCARGRGSSTSGGSPRHRVRCRRAGDR